MEPNLVAAIDGENVAFAVATAGPDLRLEAAREFKTADFPTFTDALQSYTRDNGLSTLGLPFGLAVAGATNNDIITQANCRWYISVRGLASFLASQPLVINDFAAIAWSLSGVATSRLKPIGPIPPRAVGPGRTFLVVGTGPGLGAATLAAGMDSGLMVLPSEGGHLSFAPQNAREDAILAAFRKKNGGHVSYERLLAGFGLQAIYAWVAERDGRQVAPHTPEAIIAAAIRRDPVAVEACDIFLEAMGSFVGNAVLCAGAFDGVFLVSPMLQAMLPLIERSRFRQAMVAKGRMKKVLDPVPVSFAATDQARLLGVAAAMIARGAGNA